MDELAQTLPKKTLSDRIHRELRKGETIYHSMLPCHVSKKFPDGKWIAQVRREDKSGKLIKYPVKGFGSPKEALDHIRTLRPNERGQVSLQRHGEPTVQSLYEYVREHRQKRLTESTKAGKESRWRLHIEPEWADWPLSKVTRRAAQEWLTLMEARIADGSAGTLGLAQLVKIRTDLHALFESLPSFSSEYEDRRNPFAELDFISPPPRSKVTIESQYFAPLHYACFRLVDEQLCSRWIVEVFLTALLSGLREGEVLALCTDQIDLRSKAITVDRAMRRNSRALDPKTRKEIGPVLRQAIHFPKGGTTSNPKTRVVPISDQLAKILETVIETHGNEGNVWNLVWQSESGTLKQLTRFRQGLAVLLERLQEIAALAPIEQMEAWPEIPKRRGWQMDRQLTRLTSLLNLMASFTTRVELHNADWDDYETLHAQMESKGFSRQIQSDDDTSYHLPEAEYNYSGSESTGGVLSLAKAAASATGREFAVLVTKSAGRRWFKLKKV